MHLETSLAMVGNAHSACQCLCCISVCAADWQALAMKVGCVQLLAAALKTHSGDASVTEAACDALQNITFQNGWRPVALLYLCSTLNESVVVWCACWHDSLCVDVSGHWLE